MAGPQLITKVKDFQPAAVGSDETTALYNVKKGERVLWVSIVPLINAAGSTSSTITVGDGDDVDGYVTASNLDPETATLGTPIAGSGAYLNPSGGKLYQAADTIDAVYTASGATGAKPKISVKITTLREWPS